MTDKPDLFPDAPLFEVQPRPAGTPKGPPPLQPRLVPETDCWTVEDHICRICLGRVLSRAGPDGRIFKCSDCGHQETGAQRTGGRLHPTFCACSIRLGFRDAGIRCVHNPDPRPDFPARIVAMQVE